MKIGILGMGTFGSTLAGYFSKLGHEIYTEEVKDTELIFVVVPSHAVFSALQKEKDNISNQKIVICSKGFSKNPKKSDKAMLISESLEGEFENIFFLYGPTIADELKEGKLSGMVLAGGKGKEEIKKIIESEKLRIELDDDVIGVQIGASLKNVMTIFLGIIEESGCGQNTRSYAFTKCVEEIKNFGLALGAKEKTFLGLTCVGDLILCSRNRCLGIELAKGKGLEEITKEMNYIPQGIANLQDAKRIAKEKGIKTPIIDSLYSILFENSPLNEAIKVLEKLN
ncbi:MAG: NAD(P)H-dependent glycerol-3-phosphate dehydrogenase [Candidatus Paceibacterota bacterium]|jgi:glycerol-3-phosphate dehydrogenase (NAD(P)+)